MLSASSRKRSSLSRNAFSGAIRPCPCALRRRAFGEARFPGAEARGPRLGAFPLVDLRIFGHSAKPRRTLAYFIFHSMVAIGTTAKVPKPSLLCRRNWVNCGGRRLDTVQMWKVFVPANLALWSLPELCRSEHTMQSTHALSQRRAWTPEISPYEKRSALPLPPFAHGLSWRGRQASASHSTGTSTGSTTGVRSDTDAVHSMHPGAARFANLGDHRIWMLERRRLQSLCR